MRSRRTAAAATGIEMVRMLVVRLSRGAVVHGRWKERTRLMHTIYYIQKREREREREREKKRRGSGAGTRGVKALGKEQAPSARLRSPILRWQQRRQQWDVAVFVLFIFLLVGPGSLRALFLDGAQNLPQAAAPSPDEGGDEVVAWYVRDFSLILLLGLGFRVFFGGGKKWRGRERRPCKPQPKKKRIGLSCVRARENRRPLGILAALKITRGRQMITS